MPEILLLDQQTIDKIAAGEVIERPSSVVKELVENAIDAGASAITVEIKEGGISFIRITDNGCGIESRQVKDAFLRHSTSKIRSVEDLNNVSSLGFRGEALSSISAVARVELITKTPSQLTGTRYCIEGSKEVAFEEIGAPDGTTFLIKDLFFNTPARKKFLKSPQTEGTYISDIVEKLALSHPDVSFKFINNNQTKLHTSGNGNEKDLIYHVFGREIASSILPLHYECEFFSVDGYIGKPIVSRGNRNYENYFINGRYVKSALLAKAIEEGYKKYLMQHQYPFTVLHFTINGNSLDVNVHPTKMEMRIDHNEEVYRHLYQAISDVLSGREMIPSVPLTEVKKEDDKPVYREPIPEPFEKRRLTDIRASVAKDSPYTVQYPDRVRPTMAERKREIDAKHQYGREELKVSEEILFAVPEATPEAAPATATEAVITGTQTSLSELSPDFLTQEAKSNHRIIGQVFDTYWLIEYENQLYIIDQHAAHEKVLYERKMAELSRKEFTTQALMPPLILSLDGKEVEALETYREQIELLGYQVEHFGGKEYMISGIPGNLYHLDMKDLFIEMLDDFSNASGKATPELILEKVASMSCKAAVKGNNHLSMEEMEALIDELLMLENPFHCPHGRPTIVSISKYEMEKKFKRIV